jgi:hypothetical protein
MAAMKIRWMTMAMVLLLAACGTRQALEVRPTHLRNLEVDAGNDESMIRGEQRRLLHGAIGVREQEQRLGYYYVVLWNDDSTGEPVRVVFEYQQASTGSKVRKQELNFDGSQAEGRGEFRVIGDDYLKGGRVLAWKCTLLRGGREVASRHSYLWQ